ncbi:MAG TPA: phosphoglucomutase, partial [Aequorivita sp.]|nr:phosphoglucomutase [Aequorivita sp.]
LNEIYNTYGNYREHLISITKKGKQGAEEISAMMKTLRENPFKEIADSKVVRMDDILRSETTDFTKQETLSLTLPKSNVLIYYTEDGSKIAARPSGTEPKIKFYISVNTSEKNNFEEILQKKIDAIAAQLNVS